MNDGYSPRPMGALRVSLLGAFRASVGDAALAAGGAKQRAVLAMLALRAGETVPESRLIDGIWGDETPSAVRSSLQVYVAHWRRVLADAGCAERIERLGAGYRLEMDPADVDVNRYASLVSLARAALVEERFIVAVARFDEAQTLWRGDALQDFAGMPFHQWETVPLESSRVQALADRTDALLGSGRGGELVAGLEGLVAQYPYEERFRAQLMHALYRSGRQVEAIRVVDQARSALLDVGIEVGPLLRSMEQRVLQQDPALESSVSPFSPVGPPEPITSLVGRDDEVVALVHQVTRGGERLVTLTGPGGVGKSRLALEVANRVLEEGWMPVAYLALGEAADPSVVSTTVNGAFGVPESWRERPVADVARMLGGSPLLVVIDGAEHVHEAVRTVVGDLLQHGRQLHVLVTSRVVLGLNGERQVPVGPLSCGHPPEGSLRDAPAVALFIERAERFQSGLQYEDEDVLLISEICEGVDGLPLAIELAAARSNTLGVEGLRRRLGSRLDVLAAPHQAGERRHRSLREVIAWSHGLLSTPAQALFARLSVLSGGFELEQVEEMWAHDGEPHALLESFEELDRHSLLTRVPGRGTPRFGMLDTIREYAGELLGERGETVDAHRRLIRWVHDVVDATGGRTGAGATQFDHLEREVGNVRAAVSWALEHENGDTAAELCTKLYPWWMSLSRRAELEETLTRCVQVPGVEPDQQWVLRVRLGLIASHDGRHDKSNHLLLTALQSDGVVDTSLWVQAKLCLAENFAIIGLSDRAAKELLDVSQEIKSGELDLKVRLHFSSGFVAATGSDYERARSEYEKALAGLEGQNRPEIVGKILASLAEVARLRGNYSGSRELLKQAEIVMKGLHASDVPEFVYGQLALTAALAGDRKEALENCRLCITATPDGEPDYESVARAALAAVIVAKGYRDGPQFATVERAGSELLRLLSPTLGRSAVVRRELSAAQIEIEPASAHHRIDSAQLAKLTTELAYTVAGAIEVDGSS